MTDIAVLASDPRQYDYRQEGPLRQPALRERYILFLQDVTAVFDGFKALDIHDLGIGHNELRVVVGPNGAGKTTMCDVISGLTRPTTGKVYFNGSEITGMNDAAIAASGVGRKFQIPNVFDSLTVWQNMLLALPNPARDIGNLGWYTGRRKAGLPYGVATMWALKLTAAVRNMGGRATNENRDKIHAILKRVHLLDQVDTEARSLSHGQRQWLAISTLILSEPKLLLVDEPAAGLTDSETALTADLLLELKDEHTIICIEHDMDFVRRLDSRVTVLNEGRVLAEGSLDDVSANEEVIEAYLGR